MRWDVGEIIELEQMVNEPLEILINGVKIGGAVPKPINSPLFISTIQTAYYEGVINEYEVCKRLNIKPEKLEAYL